MLKIVGNNIMLVNLSINLFHNEKVITFSEKEYKLPLYQNKFSQNIIINHFKDFVLQYEKEFDNGKFQFNIDEKFRFIEMSYFANLNNTEYLMNVKNGGY